jgi:hypothetical protein
MKEIANKKRKHLTLEVFHDHSQLFYAFLFLRQPKFKSLLVNTIHSLHLTFDSCVRSLLSNILPCILY